MAEMKNLIVFPSGRTVRAAQRNSEYYARIDNVLLAAAYHGVIKGDAQAMYKLLRAALYQPPDVFLDLSGEESELVTASDFKSLFEELLKHRVK
jgi:hypothetical protein